MASDTSSTRLGLSPTEFEDYRFLRLYSIDLDSARGTLRLLSRYRRADIRFCIVGSFVVTYSRPFSGNRGQLIPRHQLPLRFVPPPCRKLHRELIELRMKILAHSDLASLRPRVSRFGTAEAPWFPMSFVNRNFEALCRKAPEIHSLVVQVDRAIHERIAELERRL